MTESNEREAGNLMSNILFNLAQHEGHALTRAECDSMDRTRRQWDAARDAARAAAPQAQPSDQWAADLLGVPVDKLVADEKYQRERNAPVRQAQPAPAGDDFERAWDSLPDTLRCHPGIKALRRAALARSPEPAPISDAEIDKIAAQQWGHATDFAAWRRFARALLAEKGKP